MYSIVFSEDAKKDLKSLQKKAPQALSKLAELLDELKSASQNRNWASGTTQGL